MSTEIKVELPEKTIEPYIKDAVSAAIVKGLGNADDLIQSLVNKALNEKVNAMGKISDYRSENKYPYYEVIAGRAIRKYAEEAITEMANKMKPKILEAVKKELTKKENVLARSLVSGLIDSMAVRWNITVELKPKE